MPENPLDVLIEGRIAENPEGVAPLHVILGDVDTPPSISENRIHEQLILDQLLLGRLVGTALKQTEQQQRIGHSEALVPGSGCR